MTEVRAQLKYGRISPRKTRLVADAIRGLGIEEARLRVQMIEKKPAGALAKLLASAVANAKNRNINLVNLVVQKLVVDGGPVSKRFMPRAHGRATPIRRKTSHITLILGEKD